MNNNSHYKVHSSKRPCTQYSFLLVLLFISAVWYIYFSPNSNSPQDNPNKKIKQAFAPIATPHTHLGADAVLCTESDAIRYFLPLTSGARCLDGSQPAFYWKKGTGSGKNKWLVFFDGGGWCFDLPSCLARSRTPLGSSRPPPPHAPYPQCIFKDSLKHYLSPIRSANPMMSSWNIVEVKYCDGGSYGGHTDVRYNVSDPHPIVLCLY
ncbi:hypothetical protein EON65_09950 [archaeon]|nr:MAG: hypothetical protein EON65_09950 [archaeon]